MMIISSTCECLSTNVSIDQEIVKRVDIVTPGGLNDYDQKTLQVDHISNLSDCVNVNIMFPEAGGKEKREKCAQGQKDHYSPTLREKQARSE